MSFIILLLSKKVNAVALKRQISAIDKKRFLLYNMKLSFNFNFDYVTSIFIQAVDLIEDCNLSINLWLYIISLSKD
jgi:hypothetical protein